MGVDIDSFLYTDSWLCLIPVIRKIVKAGAAESAAAFCGWLSIRIQEADVTNYEDVKKVVDLALEAHGEIDVFYNNAGIMPTAPLVDGHREEWRRMLDINVMGVLNGIATDSVAGHAVYPDSAVYCGTNFAVRAIMEGLRQEQLENNMESTIISPGAVATELYKTINNKEISESLREAQEDWRLVSEDVAAAVVFAIDTPDRMSISEMIVRPTRQPI